VDNSKSRWGVRGWEGDDGIKISTAVVYISSCIYAVKSLKVEWFLGIEQQSRKSLERLCSLSFLEISV
jgi:hypothetical protein